MFLVNNLRLYFLILFTDFFTVLYQDKHAKMSEAIPALHGYSISYLATLEIIPYKMGSY